ncbi:MAG: aldehyde ferredoxin oxidoreductase N-terminal domain-containing protein [Dehalococcoidales bacterium]|nr:aldehyde ferredoxin oxidoreductase N-terminal domain-containing protein [Dehalococcoidales bacterium]
MWYGWAGTNLEVNLSRGTVKKNEGDRAQYEAYLGGRGLMTRMFWDRVPPETGPFSAENLLIFGAGPLVGTGASSANRTCLVSRSPHTNYLTYSTMGGHWGPELKHAGYDTLTFSGKSPGPVYLYINDDKVEIREASHLWGQTVHETQRLLRAELNDDDLQIMCIGPAGENKVYCASIEHGPGCSMSRTGLGAVMGDKKLKAIAVRGTRDLAIASPDLFIELRDRIRLKSAYFRQSRGGGEEGGLAKDTFYRNMEEVRDWNNTHQLYNESLSKNGGTVSVGCADCYRTCINSAHLPDGQTIFLKCRSRHRFTGAADIQDFDFNFRCIALIQKYGLDDNSSAAICGFAIDLFQKGILTKEDTDGLHLEWGNPEVIPALLEKIAHREGIGDILANGIYEAAQQIGRGAERYAYHVRKLEPRGRPMRDYSQSVKHILNDRQDSSPWGNVSYEMLAKRPRDKSVDSIYWAYPEEWKKDFPSDTVEMLSKTIAYDAEDCDLADCSGLCHFTTVGRGSALTLPREQMALLAYATGLDLDENKMGEYARRTRLILRAYNSILGERMRASDLQEQFFSGDYDKLVKMLEETNRLMGCDPEGIPMREALAEAGLDFVAGELERRGIIPKAIAEPVA